MSSADEGPGHETLNENPGGALIGMRAPTDFNEEP